MATVREVILRIGAEAKGNVAGAFKGIASGAKATASAVSGAVNALFSLKTLVAGLVFGRLIGEVRELVKAADEQALAVKRLEVALAGQGLAVSGAGQDLVQLADQLQRVTRFSDEAIIGASALMSTLGVAPGRLDEATRAALDLSTALGIDLHTSALLIGKAASGNVEAFSRYGIKIDAVKAAADPLGAVLEAVQKRMGGVAEAAGSTGAGALVVMETAISEVKEALGGLITESSGAGELFHALSDAFFGVADIISGIIGPSGVLDTIFRSIAKSVQDLDESFQGFVAGGGLVDAMNRVIAVFELFKAGILGVLFVWKKAADVLARTFEAIAVPLLRFQDSIGLGGEGLADFIERAKAIRQQSLEDTFESIGQSIEESFRAGAKTGESAARIWENMTENARKNREAADEQREAAKKQREEMQANTVANEKALEAQAKQQKAQQNALEKQQKALSDIAEKEQERTEKIRVQLGLMTAGERIRAVEVKRGLEGPQAEEFFRGLSQKEIEKFSRVELTRPMIEKFAKASAESQLAAAGVNLEAEQRGRVAAAAVAAGIAPVVPSGQAVPAIPAAVAAAAPVMAAMPGLNIGVQVEQRITAELAVEGDLAEQLAERVVPAILQLREETAARIRAAVDDALRAMRAQSVAAAGG